MAEYLADKSALTRRETRPEVRDVVEPLLLAGRIATCSVLDLELLFSARNGSSYAALAEALDGMPRAAVTEAALEHARDIQARLAQTSRHRSVPLPDLMIAGVAIVHGLTVLHYDADFDVIAAITGQPTQWVVPRGSVS